MRELTTGFQYIPPLGDDEFLLAPGVAPVSLPFIVVRIGMYVRNLRGIP